MTGGWQLGIDIGGTFTDVVAFQPATGTLRSATAKSRLDDPLANLSDGLAAVGIDWDQAADLVHGTTAITNAIVAGRLAKVALVASEGFGVETRAVDLADSRAFVIDAPDRSMALEDLIGICAAESIHRSELAMFRAPFTGEIDPAAVAGRIEGGAAQGQGYALSEDMIYENGQLMTPSFSEYLIPTAMDIPEMQSIILDSRGGLGPFGAKGIGEPALIPIAPAIANAAIARANS